MGRSIVAWVDKTREEKEGGQINRTCTGCFNPSVNFDTILFSHIPGAIPKPFNVVIVHMVRFDIMYDSP